MADDPMADALTQKLADTPSAEQQLQELQQGMNDMIVQAAGMSTAVNAAVMKAIDSIEPGSADQVLEQAQEVIDRESHAEIHRELADDLEERRADAVEDGDFGKAHELSMEQEYHLEVAHDLTHDPSVELVDAQYDTQTETGALDFADHHQEIADSNADAAVAYAASGDTDTALAYADNAADGYETAGDYADAGGGATASTTYDSYDSSGADATTE
jgi:hypothetical protein